MTLIERLRDLHKQATVERSHYYVGKCALDAADRIEALEAERDFAREAVVNKCRQYDTDMQTMQASLNREISRIETLEAALHKIDDTSIDHVAVGIARAALNQQNPDR